MMFNIKNHRLTVREVESEFSIPQTTAWKICTKILGKTGVCEKLVQKFLTTNQINLIFENAQANLGMVTAYEDDLKIIMITDKSVAYGYETKAKQQFSHWKLACQPLPKTHVNVGASSGQLLYTIIF